jgi:hypothetical protein
MNYADASLTYLRAVDHHYRMSLLGDRALILGALNLIKLAKQRRALAN